MRRFLKHNGLSLTFGLTFLLALGFQSLVGWQEFNNDEVAHAALMDERPDTICYGRYLTSSSFGQAVMENWQSEYLLSRRSSTRPAASRSATRSSGSTPTGAPPGGRARAASAGSSTPTRCCS